MENKGETKRQKIIPRKMDRLDIVSYTILVLMMRTGKTSIEAGNLCKREK